MVGDGGWHFKISVPQGQYAATKMKFDVEGVWRPQNRLYQISEYKHPVKRFYYIFSDCV